MYQQLILALEKDIHKILFPPTLNNLLYLALKTVNLDLDRTWSK